MAEARENVTGAGQRGDEKAGCRSVAAAHFGVQKQDAP